MRGPLQNGIRLQALRSREGQVISRMGSVTGYNPNNYSVKCLIQPEGIATGWIPLATPWVGPGWGMFAPPTPGDMVMVEFEDGHLQAGFVQARFFNDNAQALPVNSGEFWLVHASGAFLKLLNSGALTFSDGQGATITLQNGDITSSANQWNHTGPLSVDGDVDVTGTLAATVDVTGGSNDISLVNHTHSGVTTGTGDSGPPVP